MYLGNSILELVVHSPGLHVLLHVYRPAATTPCSLDSKDRLDTVCQSTEYVRTAGTVPAQCSASWLYFFCGIHPLIFVYHRYTVHSPASTWSGQNINRKTPTVHIALYSLLDTVLPAVHCTPCWTLYSLLYTVTVLLMQSHDIVYFKMHYPVCIMSCM